MNYQNLTIEKLQELKKLAVFRMDFETAAQIRDEIYRRNPPIKEKINIWSLISNYSSLNKSK